MKPYESTELIRLGTYAPMVRMVDGPITLNSTGKKIRLLDQRTVARVNMLNQLPGRLHELYSGKACIKQPNQEVLRKTRKCLLVGQGENAQLIQEIYDTGIVEPVRAEPIEINGFLASRKTEV